MLVDWLPIALLLGLSMLFGVASLWVSSKLGHPRRPNPHKLEPYESGIVPERLPREQFPVKFYLVAMLFIIFDIEIIFLYPWAVAFGALRLFGFVEMALFIATVFVAYAYVWRRGGLDWD